MNVIELKHLNGPSENNNVDNEDQAEETPGNGVFANHHASRANEASLLLRQRPERNGESCVVDDISEDKSEEKPTVLKRLKKELNRKVIWNIKWWMAILIAFIIIVGVILFFLFLCRGHQEDVDDKFDKSLFEEPLFFRGHFTVTNQSFVQDQTTSSNPEYNLFINLRKKLTDIYKSSPALERYFSIATIQTLSQKNYSVEYELQFKMPAENKQLMRYILSRKMVYNVLFQQLLDQDTEDPLYIEPSSLSMDDGKPN